MIHKTRNISILILLTFAFILSPLFSQQLEARGKDKLDYYASKHYIEGAYPYVNCADWKAVSQAYKNVGKNHKAKLAAGFAERMRKLEQSKQGK